MNPRRLEQNLNDVRRRMRAACERAGRDPAEVRLVAVTKTVDADAVRALADLGVTDIGENRVQEAERKREALPDLPLRWHMIGHLQTNKAKEALRVFDLIHSVDSVHLAEALDRRAVADGERTVSVLVQVSVTGEETKTGVAAVEAIDEIRKMTECLSLRIDGLMTMAPLVDNPEIVRPVFARLRQLAAQVKTLGMPRVEMRHLSMGMTQDFEVAIEEGATMVRVGTALFAGA